MTRLDDALALAAHGWRVVPIKPRTKRPPMKGWQKVATTDPERLRKWFTGVYSKAGVAVVTGPESGVWVLDVDPAAGGTNVLTQLVTEHGPLPKGPRVDTGTNGFHLYFRNPEGLHVATTKNVAGSGLDVRGTGGQVLAPPTEHAWDDCKLCADPEVECVGLDYRWHREPNGDLPDAPEWLLDLVVPARTELPLDQTLPLGEPNDSDVGRREHQPLSRPNTPPEPSAAAEMTATYDWHLLLGSDGWTRAGSESNGDTHWTRPGKDPKQGMSAILHEPEGPFVNYSTNAPELCQDWARSSRGDGWAYSIFGYIAATRHRGDRSGAARHWREEANRELAEDWARSAGGVSGGPAYPPSPLDSKEGHGEGPPDLAWAHLVEWDEFWLQDHSSQEWAVWPLIPAGRAVALFAPAKAGKSTVVLSAVAEAATGRKVLGTWETEPVSVLYLDYEMAEADVWERLQELGYGPEVDMSHLHYSLLPSIFPLDTREGAAQIVALAKHVSAQVVVIDTFSRAVHGSENDADTTRDFYRYTGMALKGEGIGVLRTDHSGKVVEQGQRGSSAKNDDVDVVWSLNRTESGVQIDRTHSRVTWVPETIKIDHVEHDDGTVAYRLAEGRQWPVGTSDLADLLTRLEVPLKASGREAARILREAGEKASNEKVRTAQQWREAHAQEEWLQPRPEPRPGSDKGLL